MAKKKLNDCKSGKDLLKLAEKYERNGECKIRPCKSSHVVVKNEKGATVIPVHGNKQLGNGILRSIRKQMAMMGIAVMIGLFIVCNAGSLGLI